MSTSERTTGMLLGKFLPPHAGHQYLIDFARNYVDDLTVVVCTLEREPIAGELRFRWVREMSPGVRVVHLTDDLPQEPAEHRDFWRLWREALRRVLPEGRIDCVFASEDYGERLARELEARFVPVDIARHALPVSGSAVRDAPLRHWRFIPQPVRPYFVRRVCIMGPESTGKTTLAGQLAEAFETVMVPEYARLHLERQGGRIEAGDIDLIARGQAASEDALAAHANRLLICDTDLLTTTIWSEVLFGDCPRWLRETAQQRAYDLTLLLHPDVPWVDDQTRYLPGEGEAFFVRCKEALVSSGRPFVEIRGDWRERFERAREAVRSVIE